MAWPMCGWVEHWNAMWCGLGVWPCGACWAVCAVGAQSQRLRLLKSQLVWLMSWLELSSSRLVEKPSWNAGSARAKNQTIRFDPSRANYFTSRASQRATSISSSPSRHAHTRVCHVAPNLPEPFPAPQGPSVPSPSSPANCHHGRERRCPWLTGAVKPSRRPILATHP